jgi:hypothetical protein
MPPKLVVCKCVRARPSPVRVAAVLQVRVRVWRRCGSARRVKRVLCDAVRVRCPGLDATRVRGSPQQCQIVHTFKMLCRASLRHTTFT